MKKKLFSEEQLSVVILSELKTVFPQTRQLRRVADLKNFSIFFLCFIRV